MKLGWQTVGGMPVHISGHNGRDAPEPGGCCWADAVGNGCTCWEPVYSEEQQPHVEDAPVEIAPEPCIDCAYRGRSPERVDGELAEVELTGRPFWCHQGIRYVVEYVHPTGARNLAPLDDAGQVCAYEPPMVGDGMPLRADGTPANLCAGWVAWKLARS